MCKFVLGHDKDLDSDCSHNFKRKLTPNFSESLTDLFGVIAIENQRKRLDVDSEPHGLQGIPLFITTN